MTEKQFFEQWNRIVASGDIDIPERIDWREVQYMLAYRKRDQLSELSPYKFVVWCADNYWTLNKHFWEEQTAMLERLKEKAATALLPLVK